MTRPRPSCACALISIAQYYAPQLTDCGEPGCGSTLPTQHVLPPTWQSWHRRLRHAAQAPPVDCHAAVRAHLGRQTESDATKRWRLIAKPGASRSAWYQWTANNYARPRACENTARRDGTRHGRRETPCHGHAGFRDGGGAGATRTRPPRSAEACRSRRNSDTWEVGVVDHCVRRRPVLSYYI